MPREFPIWTNGGPALGDPYPDRISQFPGEIVSHGNVVYSVVQGFRPMTLDVYRSKKTKGNSAPKPLILYVHGGGWMGGNTRASGAFSNFPAVLAKLAGEGFVVASVDYRLSAEAPYPAQLQDVRAAIRFLKTNAAKYGIDPARTGIWGGSAGGHLAALAALTCGAPNIDPEGTKAAPGSECIQAAVTWYGVFDAAAMVTPYAPSNPLARLLRCDANGCPKDALDNVSPSYFVDGKDPPFLLMHGEADSTVPASQSHAFEEKLKAAGVPVEAIYLAGADHSWLGKTGPETRAFSLRAINATFDYFHRALKTGK